MWIAVLALVATLASMELMYLLSITAASRSIDLSAAYFVADDLSLKALLAAMQRGARLRISVPGEHIDSETVRLASKAKWGGLLAAGARIFEFAPTLFHCKVMIGPSDGAHTVASPPGKCL